MSCLNPSMAWQDMQSTTRNGSHPVIFAYSQLDKDYYRWRHDDQTGETVFVSSRYVPLNVPCGKCLLCRKTRAYEITCRAYMEYMAYPDRPSAFVTLTVDDEHMQQVFPGGLLQHRPWQLFAKRFRKALGGVELRYLMCGEYGEISKRPHYHAIIYGWEPCDPAWSDDGRSYCDSLLLARCWPYGHIMARRVNYNVLAYVAGYQLKLDGIEIDGELDDCQIPRNYVRWSRNPGLGYDFLLRYPNMIRDLESQCDDGYRYKQRSFVLVNRKVMPFHSRYLLKVLKDLRDGVGRKKSLATPLQLRAEYDTMCASRDRGVILRHCHTSRLSKEVQVEQLKTRREALQLRLNAKMRDIGV